VASLAAWAAAARREAERSRTHALSLRVELHRQLRAREEQVERLRATVTVLEQRRYEQFRTAWSDLLWRRPKPYDEHVLELVDR
jgi:hypothetical protein